MSVTSVSIENFTVFEELEISFSEGINVFIGDNGTGKTHLLKLLYAFCESNRIDSLNKETSENAEEFTDKNREVYVKSNIDKNFDILIDKYFLSKDKSELFRDKGKPVMITVHSDMSDLFRHIAFADDTPFARQPKQEELQYTDRADVRTNHAISAVFIPAKEMLTHTRLEKDYMYRKLPFDETLIDIINKVSISELRNLTKESREMIEEIENIICGKVVYKNDAYFIERDGSEYSFQIEAEGYKKFALLSRLIETGILAKDSILLWDEPEANINPQNIPTLVDILFGLQRLGVQIFVATHNYVFAKYIEVRKKTGDCVMFHALHKESFDAPVRAESDPCFTLLDNNSIVRQSIDLYKEEIDRSFK
jgi:predicted ATP-dependent endonuclease of OLD family